MDQTNTDSNQNTNNEIIINASIDEMLSNMSVGSISRAIGNNLYGINLRQTGNVVPKSKDMYGFTFFTRPQLNLTRLNITNYRGFYSLLTSNNLSYQAFTRLTLDPRLHVNGNISCPFVDNENAFISVLTNNIVSLSGWPDLAVPSYTSSSGLYGEEISFVDGVTNHFESFDLDISFKNTKGNPLIYLFYIWIKYESLVFEGILNPYMDMITENEIDYNTRIYRLVLDQDKRYIRYIASTGASFPINVPTGNLFDYDSDTPYNTKNNEINIRFRCSGFTAFEDILKLEFNKTSAIFNPSIRKILEYDMEGNEDISRSRDDSTIAFRVPGCSYVKIPHHLCMGIDNDITNNLFYNLNHRVYPYINLITNELEWWADERRFNTVRNEPDVTNIADTLGPENSTVR